MPAAEIIIKNDARVAFIPKLLVMEIKFQVNGRWKTVLLQYLYLYQKTHAECSVNLKHWSKRR